MFIRSRFASFGSQINFFFVGDHDFFWVHTPEEFKRDNFHTCRNGRFHFRFRLRSYQRRRFIHGIISTVAIMVFPVFAPCWNPKFFDLYKKGSHKNLHEFIYQYLACFNIAWENFFFFFGGFRGFFSAKKLLAISDQNTNLYCFSVTNPTGPNL